MATWNAEIVDMPDDFYNHATSRHYPRPSSFVSSSPITGEETAMQGHARWVMEFSFGPLDEDIWRRWEGFKAEQRGQVGLVRVYDPANDYPNGAVGGARPGSVIPGQPWSDASFFTDGTGWQAGSVTALVYAAAERGDNEIVMSGLLSSESISLESGDNFGVDGLLYKILKRAASNASGQARVRFFPNLRASVAAGAVVQFWRPTFVARFNSDEEGVIERSPPMFGTTGARFIEVLPTG